jgi:hypothetical protein
MVTADTPISSNNNEVLISVILTLVFGINLVGKENDRAVVKGETERCATRTVSFFDNNPYKSKAKKKVLHDRTFI